MGNKLKRRENRMYFAKYLNLAVVVGIKSKVYADITQVIVA
jgi:hypothetical protein